MPTDQRPCLIEFLWLLQQQGDVDAQHHDRLRAGFVRHHVALAERGPDRVRPSDALAKKLGEWDHSGAPIDFAYARVVEGLTWPVLDEPSGDKAAEGIAIDFLLGGEARVITVLKRAIAMQGIEPKARLKAMSEDRAVMEVMRQLARFDEDGRTDELLQVMHERFHDHPGRTAWPQPTSWQGGEGANIHVGNLVLGDQITARESTVVTHSEIKDGSKVARDEHSATLAARPKAWSLGCATGSSCR